MAEPNPWKTEVKGAGGMEERKERRREKNCGLIKGKCQLDRQMQWNYTVLVRQNRMSKGRVKREADRTGRDRLTGEAK